MVSGGKATTPQRGWLRGGKKEMKEKAGRLHEIVLLILIIGMTNIYDMLKNINISVYDLININGKNILFLLFITLIFFFIFSQLTPVQYTVEYEIMLGLGLIGIYFIILSNDFLLFYLALELYSLSVYLLIFKNTPHVRSITILYFLIGSISSSFILLGIALLYNSTGSLDIQFILQNIDTISSYLKDDNIGLRIGLILLFSGLLFKIGGAPFQFWVLRVYPIMDIKILMYQAIIPKITFIFVLSLLIPPVGVVYEVIIKLILFAAFLSLFVGPIGGISNGVNKFKKIIAYSSILHVGYLLLGLAANNFYLSQYLLIYGVNTLQFLLAFSSFQYASPLLYFFFLISIFSFIGLPPFAGFYGKLMIILNCFYTSNLLLQIFGILFIILSTLIAAFLYLKFINFFYFKSKLISPPENIDTNTGGNVYFLSFLSLFLLVYPIYLPYFNPFFELLF